MIYALLAALLFGTAAPLSKMLLAGWGTVRLAGALYLASGSGLMGVRQFVRNGEPLRRNDLPYLGGAILTGGILAPVALLYGLRQTTAHAAALLINLETVFTALIAVCFFRERLAVWDWFALVMLVVGASVVGLGESAGQGTAHPWLGAGLVALAGLGWGLDNNFTQRISTRDPLQLAGVKGLVAGSVNTLLGLVLREPAAGDLRRLGGVILVGLLCYGMSLVFFVLSLRTLKAARTSALFATAPVSGVLLSWLLLHERPGWMAVVGGSIMISGVMVMALAPKPRVGAS